MEMTFEELLKEHKVQIYHKFLIKAKTENRLLGGWPKNPSTELAMLEARANKGLVKPETVEEARSRIQQASSDNPEEETEKARMKAWTGFKSDEVGIYMESRQVKAGFKETATTLGLTATHRGVRQVLQHSFFARGTKHPDRIYLRRSPSDDADSILQEPDGYEELVAHVIGPQGPRSTIKLHDFVEPDTYFDFEIWFADPKEGRMNEKFLAHCMALAQENGFGCSRSQGYGRVKFLTIEKIADGKLPKAPGKKTTK